MPNIISSKNIAVGYRAAVVADIIKNAENILDTSVTQFLDATPMICDYLAIDKEASTYNIGTNDDAGAYSGSRKYKLIENYVMYGHIDEKAITKEKDEVSDIKYNMEEITSLHLPNTILPVEGDRILLHINNGNVIYKVVRSEPTTFNNKPYYKSVMKIDDSLPSINYNLENMKKDGLISDTFIYNGDSLGTDYSPFIKRTTLLEIRKLQDMRNEINTIYNDNFYNINKNVFLYQSSQTVFHYFPMLNYIQEEFAPLWDNNGINMILHHETLTKRQYLSVYKKSNIRRFLLNRANNFLETGEDITHVYEYTNLYTKSTFKIQSYLNDNNSYKIHEIVEINSDSDYKTLLEDAGMVDSTIDLSQFVLPKLTTPTVIKIPVDILDILKEYKTIDIKDLNEYLEDVFIEYSLEYLYYTPILLIVLDNYLEGIMYNEKRNQFY